MAPLTPLAHNHGSGESTCLVRYFLTTANRGRKARTDCQGHSRSSKEVKELSWSEPPRIHLLCPEARPWRHSTPVPPSKSGPISTRRAETRRARSPGTIQSAMGTPIIAVHGYAASEAAFNRARLLGERLSRRECSIPGAQRPVGLSLRARRSGNNAPTGEVARCRSRE
jgi:hypothetical protein